MKKQILFLFFINFFGASNIIYAPTSNIIYVPKKEVVKNYNNKRTDSFAVKNVFKKIFYSAKFYYAVAGVTVLAIVGKLIIFNSNDASNDARNVEKLKNLKKVSENNEKLLDELKGDVRRFSVDLEQSRENRHKKEEERRSELENSAKRLKEAHDKLFNTMKEKLKEQEDFAERIKIFIEYLCKNYSLPNSDSFPKSNDSGSQFGNGCSSEREKHLRVLGLHKKNPSSEEIRKAFKDEMMRWHPDKNGGCTTARAQEINEAYNFLKNEL